MADQAETTAPAETADTATDTTTTEAHETETVDWKAEAEKWKSNSRKNEEKAKANAAAAARLQELEDANKTEQEKLSDALKAAESKATHAETESARLKAAVKHGLSEDDLDLLGAGTPDEIEARAEKLAARLAASTTSSASRPVTGLGKTPDDSAKGGSQFERDLREQLGI